VGDDRIDLVAKSAVTEDEVLGAPLSCHARVLEHAKSHYMYAEP
jgi:hypothetical protein